MHYTQDNTNYGQTKRMDALLGYPTGSEKGGHGSAENPSWQGGSLKGANLVSAGA